MEFTVELRYQSGSSTVLSIQARTADQALESVRDPPRPLTESPTPPPADEHLQAPEEPRRSDKPVKHRRLPAQHRPSRRHRLHQGPACPPSGRGHGGVLWCDLAS